MVVGHAQSEGHPRTVSLDKFAEDVAAQTYGHVKVLVYPDGQLGTEKEMLEMVVYGTIQGLRGGHYDFSPRLLMFTLPFLCRNSARGDRAAAKRSGYGSLHERRGSHGYRDHQPVLCRRFPSVLQQRARDQEPGGYGGPEDARAEHVSDRVHAGGAGRFRRLHSVQRTCT